MSLEKETLPNSLGHILLSCSKKSPKEFLSSSKVIYPHADLLCFIELIQERFNLIFLRVVGYLTIGVAWGTYRDQCLHTNFLF